MSDPVESLSEERPRVSLAEVLECFDVVDLEETHAVVAAREASTDRSSLDLRELGSTGSSQWGAVAREDYNPQLRGYMGMRKFDQMRKGDGQVRAALRLAKTPVLAARWYVEPASESSRDQKIAQFIWDNLAKWMSASWYQLLDEVLHMLDFGFYCFEPVYEIVDGKVRWKKLAPRHPMDLIEFTYDSHGGPTGAKYANPDDATETWIPIEKLLIFTYDKEGGNLSGVSLLRSAYKHWYFKETLYKIDAIQKERHGIGIPVIKLPPNFDDSDKRLANELGRNLRTNEKAHIVIPPNWEVMFAQLQGQPVDCMKSVEHHNEMIFANILGQFMLHTTDYVGGSQNDMFVKATRYVADIVRDVINKYLIPKLVDWNWNVNGAYPELRVRRIGDTTDWRTVSFAMRNFVGADLLTPDDRLEEWIRDEMDLPKFNPASAREPQTPQGPGGAKTGLPRQSKASGMKQQAQGTGKSNAGNDGSGG